MNGGGYPEDVGEEVAAWSWATVASGCPDEMTMLGWLTVQMPVVWLLSWCQFGWSMHYDDVRSDWDFYVNCP
ncbi:MAG: hypothetical protein QOG87_543 [Actinomycetota bacterium]